MAILGTLLLPHLPQNSNILDVCCGTGHLARSLTDAGLRVTGIDASREMLNYARKNAPLADLVLGDARQFSLLPTFDAAVSTLDSLNHFLTLDELAQVFCNVRRALKVGGLFLFDVNMEEGFRIRWSGSATIVASDNVLILRASYKPHEKIGRNDITMFRIREGDWVRSDMILLEKCYSKDELNQVIANAGFVVVSHHDAATLSSRHFLDLSVSRNIGRALLLVRKMA